MSRINKAISILLAINNMNNPIPQSSQEKLSFFKALRTITMPTKLPPIYYEIEAEVLDKELKTKNIIKAEDILEKLTDNIYIRKGDITTIEAGAIVNAANEQALGCFIPHHKCIDNAINCAGGMMLRNACHDVMQGRQLVTGDAFLTKGYNLPSQYVIHTVGPNLKAGGYSMPTDEHQQQLKSCYTKCLDLAYQNEDIDSIVFCSISTGVYGYPIQLASQAAIETIEDYIQQNGQKIKVIIDVFSEEDYEIYKRSAKHY